MLRPAVTRGPVYTPLFCTAKSRTVIYSRRIVSASSGKTVRLWDAETGKELRCFEGHTDEVWDVVYSPDGRRVLSSSSDRTIRLWKLPK